MMAPAFPISAFCMRSGDPPTIPSSPKASACGRTFRGLCFNNSLLRPPLTSNVKLTQERPDLFGQVQSSVLAVAGALQSKFGPASENYFNAKRSVTARHQLGELSENLAFEYARAHKIEEATVGLSLLCSLPVSAVERALANTEMTLVLAKANDFKWETAMVLLFLRARDHRIMASDLDDMKAQFSKLNVKTSQEILTFFQPRRQAASARLDQWRLPELHSI
jgi:hypothetical protein